MKLPLQKILTTVFLLCIIVCGAAAAADSLEDSEPDTVIIIDDSQTVSTYSSLRNTPASTAPPQDANGIYQISTADHLIWFSAQVNAGVGARYNAVLINDIDMTEITDWQPIGAVSPYGGTFDGGRYSIKNLHITAEDIQFVGLFGKVAGTVKDLTLDESCSVSVKITENFEANIWVASMICVTGDGSVIENCHNNAAWTVNAVGSTASSALTALVGGVLGQHSGLAKGCTNSGEITVTVNGGDTKTGTLFAGGVVSRNYNGEVTSCNNTGDIEVKSTRGSKAMTIYTGGVIGQGSRNEVKNLKNTADISLTDMSKTGGKGAEYYLGGIIGKELSGTVSNCHNTGKITATLQQSTDTAALKLYSGGIIGHKSGGLVELSINDGEVSSDSANHQSGSLENSIGGGVGKINDATMNSCMNTAMISLKIGKYNIGRVGGVAGYAEASTVLDSTNSGNILGEASNSGNFYAGGVVGDSYTADYVSQNGNYANGFYAIIDNAYNSGSVTVKGTSSQSFSVGGIAGDSHYYDAGSYTRRTSYIINSQNIGDITEEVGEKNRCNIGGIAGAVTGHIYNSMNMGNITANSLSGANGSTFAGGIAGFVDYNSGKEHRIINCYSAGRIFGNSKQPHPFVSLTYTGTKISYSYALSDVSVTMNSNYYTLCDTFSESQMVNYGESGSDNTLETALNTRAKEQTSDTPYEWMSWKIEDGINNGYPILDKLVDNTRMKEAEYQKTKNGEWITGSLERALREVYDGGTVRLLTDVNIESKTLTLTKDITLTSADSTVPKMIYSTTGNHGSLIHIRSGTVTLKDIILDGGYKSDGTGVISQEALINILGYCTLYIEEGTEIRNNYNTISVGSNINQHSAGGINAYERSVVIMNGGSIHNNYCCISGGVQINNGASFTLNNGEIRDNTAYYDDTNKKGYGGGVYVYSGTFTMNEGTIQSNSAYIGGGIFQPSTIFASDGSIVNTGFVYLNGGIITQNNADSFAGGLGATGSPTIQWNGIGTLGKTVVKDTVISENTATIRSGGVEIYPGWGLYISGLVKIADNQAQNSDNDNAVLRNYPADITHAGYFVIEGMLSDGSIIYVDSNLKHSDPSLENLLVAKGTATYTITPSDFKKFICENSEYALYLDTEENCIYLMTLGPVVTFDTTGGSQIDAIMAMPGGNTIDRPDEEPTKENHTFIDWFTSEDEGKTLSQTPYDFINTTVTEDITLYAKWKELDKYIVSYDLNGGVGADGTDYSAVSVYSGNTVTVNPAPTKEGVSFINWVNGTNSYNPGDVLTVTLNITLTANWTDKDDELPPSPITPPPSTPSKPGSPTVIIVPPAPVTPPEDEPIIEPDLPDEPDEPEQPGTKDDGCCCCLWWLLLLLPLVLLLLLLRGNLVYRLLKRNAKEHDYEYERKQLKKTAKEIKRRIRDKEQYGGWREDNARAARLEAGIANILDLTGYPEELKNSAVPEIIKAARGKINRYRL